MAASDFYSGLPRMLGMDFGLNRPGVFGRGIDLTPFSSVVKAPPYSSVFKGSSGTPSFTPTAADYEGGDKPSTGDVGKEIDKLIKYRAQTLPINLAEMQAAAGLQSALTRQQIRDVYPYLSAAASEATARNLAASQAYRAFAEQLPSSVQNIMASKQQQRQSAQAGEAALQEATAKQMQAAKESQGRFAGQYISFA